jgi:hypothetical protein
VTDPGQSQNGSVPGFLRERSLRSEPTSTGCEMSTVYDCSREDDRRAGLAAAAGELRSARLVVFPTDTVYGIGCAAVGARRFLDRR